MSSVEVATVCPSYANTGSANGSLEIGHRNSSGTSISSASGGVAICSMDYTPLGTDHHTFLKDFVFIRPSSYFVVLCDSS